VAGAVDFETLRRLNPGFLESRRSDECFAGVGQMKIVATVLVFTLTAALVAGCGSGHRPGLAFGLDSSEASLPLARGLSLPAGHPPLESGLLALPEGHPPLVDGDGALPEGHPRCPRGEQMPQEAPQLDFNVRSGADEVVST
jgi:hypothetical protein